MLVQIDRVLAKYDEAKKGHGGLATWPDDVPIEVVTLMRATGERLAPRGRAYLKNAHEHCYWGAGTQTSAVETCGRRFARRCR